jgi:hypothetical protein
LESSLLGEHRPPPPHNLAKTRFGIKGTKVKLLRSDVWDINCEDDVDPHLNSRPDPHLMPHHFPLVNYDLIPTSTPTLIHDPIPTRPPPPPLSTPTNKNEYKNEERKKEKINKKEKIHFRDFVTLTQKEYDQLLDLHGKEPLEIMLDMLDSYKCSSGRLYVNDSGVFRRGGWILRKYAENQKNGKNNQKPPLNGLQSPEGKPKFVAKNLLSVEGNF